MKPWTEEQITWARAYFLAKATDESTERMVAAYVNASGNKLSRDQAQALIVGTKASIEALCMGIGTCLRSGRTQEDVIAEVAWFTGLADLAGSLVSGVAQGLESAARNVGKNPMSPSQSPRYLAEPKSRGVALVLSFLLGMLGADRFYLGSRGMAMGKALTLGGVYCWWIADFILLLRGKMKDSYGRVVGQCIPAHLIRE